MPLATFQAVVQAGERLVDAQEFEFQCAELYRRHPEQRESRAAWLAARKLAEHMGDAYLKLCVAFRDEQTCSFAESGSEFGAVCP